MMLRPDIYRRFLMQRESKREDTKVICCTKELTDLCKNRCLHNKSTYSMYIGCPIINSVILKYISASWQTQWGFYKEIFIGRNLLYSLTNYNIRWSGFYTWFFRSSTSWLQLRNLCSQQALKSCDSIRNSASERRKIERGKESPGLALLAGAHTDIWLHGEGGSEYITVVVSWQMLCLGKETKMLFPLYAHSFILMYYTFLGVLYKK